jgi:hypothetical protein
MRELKGEHGQAPSSTAARGARAAAAEIRFELNPDEDAQLYEARVDFLGASGERASETVQRAVELRAGTAAQLAATLQVPSSAKTLRLVLVLADRTTWQHDIALA